MKALFITYNQAYNEEIVEMLEDFGQRGFTRWEDIMGRGSKDGIPRMGSHAWPEMNHAVLSVVEDDIVPQIMEEIKKKDTQAPALGLRAFVWNIESIY